MTFEIDSNGILSVSASDKGTGKEEEITISAERTAASKEEIDEMLRRAKEFEEVKAASGGAAVVLCCIARYGAEAVAKRLQGYWQQWLPHKTAGNSLQAPND